MNISGAPISLAGECGVQDLSVGVGEYQIISFCIRNLLTALSSLDLCIGLQH